MNTEPQCPRCGTPARTAILERARVRCTLNRDGSLGRVLSTSREAQNVVGYECGGGHTWKVPVAPTLPEDPE